MAPDKRDWTVPAPLRMLMWWPGVAFVLVMIAPEAAAMSIAVSGAVLVAFGALFPVLARRLRGALASAAVEAPDMDPPTIEIDLQTIEIPPVHRAA